MEAFQDYVYYYNAFYQDNMRRRAVRWIRCLSGMEAISGKLSITDVGQGGIT